MIRMLFSQFVPEYKRVLPESKLNVVLQASIISPELDAEVQLMYILVFISMKSSIRLTPFPLQIRP